MSESGDARELPDELIEKAADAVSGPRMAGPIDREIATTVLLVVGLPELLARVEAAEADRDRYYDALHNAEAFIVTVTRWEGQEEDYAETMDELRSVLAGSQEGTEDG